MTPTARQSATTWKLGALEFICNRRFHNTFFLPPNPQKGRPDRFRVSYSDYGDRNSDAVVLFCGALMGTRLSYSPLDQLAKMHRVRIVHPDRPGIGGTDPVEQHERINIWLEIVPQLLAHLKVPHVALASHSGGDVYLLNTLLTFPHLLHPITPYIAFFAPWVHQSHSGVKSLRVTELLPTPLIGRFASLARFIHTNVIPLAGLSSGFRQGLKGPFSQSTSSVAPVSLSPSPTIRSRASSIKDFFRGLDLDDPKIVMELHRLIITYLFAENTDGISADAQLFLRKPHKTVWCAGIFWSDVDYVVPLIRKMILEEHTDNADGRKWLVDTFHAETDNMVGAKGQAWFDDCWTYIKPSSASVKSNTSTATTLVEQQSRNSLEYRSEVVPNTEHNYLLDPGFDCSDTWLGRIREAFPPKEEEEDLEALNSTASTTPESRRRHRLPSFIARTRRAMHTLRNMRSRNASPSGGSSMFDGEDSDRASTRACRKGKLGSGVKVDKYGF